MDYKYFPHTAKDVREMLDTIGVTSLEDLYAEVPATIRFQGEYDIPSAKSELEIRQLFDRLGRENRPLTCFAGAASTTTTLLP